MSEPLTRTCAFCEYFDGGGEAAVRPARNGERVIHGDCLNSHSPRFTTASDDTCLEFFPEVGMGVTFYDRGRELGTERVRIVRDDCGQLRVEPGSLSLASFVDSRFPGGIPTGPGALRFDVKPVTFGRLDEPPKMPQPHTAQAEESPETPAKHSDCGGSMPQRQTSESS